jgi:hypothetical protein
MTYRQRQPSGAHYNHLHPVQTIVLSIARSRLDPPKGGTVRILLLALFAALAAVPATADAQRPVTVGVTANDSLAPLPVVDDFGDMIPEPLIQSHMRHGRVRWYMQPVGFIAGGLVAYAGLPHGKSNDNCSIYDPCSDREKFYRESSFWVGGLIGSLLLNAAGPGTTRLQAIERIREERRAIHSETDRR